VDASFIKRRPSLAESKTPASDSSAPALLALEDGTVFRGIGFGAAADHAG
jgi:hypothetical protein